MSNWFSNKLRIARSLSFSEWLALTEAWWGSLGFYLVLRRTSFERLQASRERTAQDGVETSNSHRVALQLHRSVILASRLHLLPITCLIQALTLRRMLDRRSILSEVRIGAKKTSLGIHAHAWVDVQGLSIGEEDNSEGFSPLESVDQVGE